MTPHSFISRMQLAAIILFIAFTLAQGSREPVARLVLRANTPLDTQVASLDGRPSWFMLADLHSRSSYEVRVSYPATTPATIQLRLINSKVVRSRRLLDTEKLIFHTDANGYPNGEADALIELRAYGRFVHRDGPDAGPKELIYKIVCQELLLHAVPTDTLPTIAVCLLLFGVIWIFAPYFSRRVVPRVLRWVLGAEKDDRRPAARTSPPP